MFGKRRKDRSGTPVPTLKRLIDPRFPTQCGDPSAWKRADPHNNVKGK